MKGMKRYPHTNSTADNQYQLLLAPGVIKESLDMFIMTDSPSMPVLYYVR